MEISKDFLLYRMNLTETVFREILPRNIQKKISRKINVHCTKNEVLH